MKVLIDISHPAHVHFYRHVRARLLADGHDVLVVARRKDVTIELLRAFGIPHLISGRSGHSGWPGQFRELVQRDLFMFRRGREFRPDVVLTRNPTGIHAARALGAIGVFDTDDGRSVGVHYYAAAPFATIITAPDCMTESFGLKGRKYPSYKSLAYLHPAVFRPSNSVKSELGLHPNEPFSILRLVAHDASHDRKARGIGVVDRRRLIQRLEEHGAVFLSVEGPYPDEFSSMRLPTRPELIHDVLAEASMVVGDSQTVATEAALLGTPSIRINSWAEAVPHLTELERQYDLTRSYGADDFESAFRDIERLLGDPRIHDKWIERRDRMLEDKVNLTDWYVELLEQLAEK